MNDTILLTEQQDGVTVITLNRPEVMNSFNFALLHALAAKIADIRFDPDVRVIIVIGSGDRAFCSGADLKERATLSPIQVKEYIFTIRNLFTAIEQLNKPVIAAVNGVALGGGTELALASDIRIASETASMGLTETRLAIIPGAGGTQRLPRLVGRFICQFRFTAMSLRKSALVCRRKLIGEVWATLPPRLGLDWPFPRRHRWS